MKIAVKDGMIYLKDIPQEKSAIIKTWSRFKFDRKTGIWAGDSSLENFNLLRTIMTLPPILEAEVYGLQSRQKAVDYIRTMKDPKPLADFPVKKNLFIHQTRAADMALVTFGVISPEDAMKIEKGGSDAG